MEVIVHYPESKEDQAEIQKRLERIHAQFVLQYIEKLNCPQWQKEKLLDAVAATIRERAKEESSQI